MKCNLERFKCIIRPYAHALSDPNMVECAVVIPFSNKEDCMNFVRQTNLTIAGIDDDVPQATPLGTVGEDTMSRLLPEVLASLKESKETD